MRQQAPASFVEEGPLSHEQQSPWFLHRVDPRSAAYHVALAARVVEDAAAPLAALDGGRR